MRAPLVKNTPPTPPRNDGVMLFNWRDTGIVLFMSTVHTSEGFILRLRRRYRTSGTGLAACRRPFEFSIDADDLSPQNAHAFHLYKVMLPIPRFIDMYNHHMNGVDLADQLRAVYCTQQPSVHNWHPYFYYFLDTAIVNSYLLWRWTREAIGGINPHTRRNGHRFYRETLVEALMEGIPVQYEHIVVRQNHQFIRPNQYNIPVRFHIPTPGAPRVWYYFCRYQQYKRVIRIGQMFRTRERCESCDVPLCHKCFRLYHLQVGVIGGGDSGREASIISFESIRTAQADMLVMEQNMEIRELRAREWWLAEEVLSDQDALWEPNEV